MFIIRCESKMCGSTERSSSNVRGSRDSNLSHLHFPRDLLVVSNSFPMKKGHHVCSMPSSWRRTPSHSPPGRPYVSTGIMASSERKRKSFWQLRNTGLWGAGGTCLTWESLQKVRNQRRNNALPHSNSLSGVLSDRTKVKTTTNATRKKHTHMQKLYGQAQTLNCVLIIDVFRHTFPDIKWWPLPGR